MTLYTHWLITKGRGPEWYDGRQKITPLMLVGTDVGLPGLRRRVAEEIALRSKLFVKPDASAIEELRASAGAYAVGTLPNLWLSEVRLSSHADAGPSEETIRWILYNPDTLAPPWQGPADGVIPKETPVTVRKWGAEAMFQVIDM
jgi:hypothetical protein